MTKRRSKNRGGGQRKRAQPIHRPRVGSGLIPWPGIVLDYVSAISVHQDREFVREAAEVYCDLDTAWRRQVADRRDEINAVLMTASAPFKVEGWQRLLQYRYSQSPLSCAGSVLLEEGGRFNHGCFAPLTFPAFPALYLAEDRETAWLERYSISQDADGEFSPAELMLRQKESVAYVSVSGALDRVVDLSRPERLDDLVTILATFEIPRDRKSVV